MSASDIANLKGKLVLLGQQALAALDQVETVEQLQTWRKIYIEGKPPHPATALFSTFVSTKELLDWDGDDGLPVRCALLDGAYSRWYGQDAAQAESYSGAWCGHVEAVPGGYHVWIEAET
jgi:hypothetical protein